MRKDFVNTFDSWKETFYEMTLGIHAAHEGQFTTMQPSGLPMQEGMKEIMQTFDTYGRLGLISLAEEWTDEFELINEGRQWDGELWDEIDDFISNKLK